MVTAAVVQDTSTAPPARRPAPRRRGAGARICGLLAVLAVGGCASGGSGETGGLTLPTVPMPKMELPKVDLSKVELPKVELPEAAPQVVGTPTEVYTRVARGALNCWFGANGPLKGHYIYHADAESPSRGGKAEISVHERDTANKDPRGGRALKIFIVPEGDTAKVTYENHKIPAALGDAMRRDVDRWAADRMGCEPIPDQSAWTSETQSTPAATAAVKPAAVKGTSTTKAIRTAR